MGGIISTSQHDSKIVNADEFTDDAIEPVWTSSEEHELMNTILFKIDWDALADILQENDIDKTGQECRYWTARKFNELRDPLQDDNVNFSNDSQN